MCSHANWLTLAKHGLLISTSFGEDNLGAESMEEKLSPELVRDFVIAGHGDLGKVKELLSKHPELLNAAYPWNETDKETALQAASQVGNVAIAQYLLSKGARLDICTAAMLGEIDQVENFLDNDPSGIRAAGAHGIPLLPHAVMSGNLRLLELLVKRGASAGASHALHNAVSRGFTDIARWLLMHTTPDLNWKNYQGKTTLAVATDRKDGIMIHVLREHCAKE